MSRNTPLRKFVITTGDIDGIGLEVTYKALLKISLPAGVHLSVYEPQNIPRPLRALRRRVIRKYHLENVSSRHAIALMPSNESPAKWVFMAAQDCKKKIFAGMITAPLSKTLINDSGYSQIGHTEILASVSGRSSLFMAFLGKKFNVVLVTGHLPLRRVSRAMSVALITSALRAANRLRDVLPRSQRARPLGLVGLNPHAGESGLIGHEEARIFRRSLRALEREKIHVRGPLVPDAAFLRPNWAKYSVFVCPYHDQGLIPFKLVHGADSGAHVTLGLPFVRTSVDHGTAKDIFGKDVANPNSMCDAIMWAIRLST